MIFDEYEDVFHGGLPGFYDAMTPSRLRLARKARRIGGRPSPGIGRRDAVGSAPIVDRV
jgi:hypothetical protein